MWARVMWILLLTLGGLLKVEKTSAPLYPWKPTGLPEQIYKVQGNLYYPRRSTGFDFSSSGNGLYLEVRGPDWMLSKVWETKYGIYKWTSGLNSWFHVKYLNSSSCSSPRPWMESWSAYISTEVYLGFLFLDEKGRKLRNAMELTSPQNMYL